ncbi:hypothetical protein CHARACLAT_021761 [Characodon lateralis]|uniref:Uncharacterized protein n=1 Tax=Characodon lateralis TaxID=208331 RepID=A0ABU7E2S2_9TELE|nr:hypothetical protein [Characodon lateralis]
MSRAGKRGRRSSAGSLDSNMEGSIISSPHTRRRPTTAREGSSRGHPSIPNSASTSILGSLFGSKRGKPSSQSQPPLPPPGHPTLISHKPHPTNLHHTAQAVHTVQAQLHGPHPQYCQVPQNPPPYHHHHHYHPPPHTQYHQHPAYSSHAHHHSQHGHYTQHPHHAPHPQHHSQQPGQSHGGHKPKHSGISTVV